MVARKPQTDPTPQISESIRVFRGHRVLTDADLALLYGVTTARLNQQFRRNRDRFPADFAFEIPANSDDILMLQNATSSPGHGGRRKPIVVFTEHGAIMAATVLSSPRAVQMTVYIARLCQVASVDLLSCPIGEGARDPQESRCRSGYGYKEAV
ncbi:MAG: ORF6N domain-containing protein [Steroidobacteraceae bacterium]